MAKQKKVLPGRFLLREGKHHLDIDTGKRNDLGAPIKVRKTYRAGDVVISHLDLERRFNGPTTRKMKFQYLGTAEEAEILEAKKVPEILTVDELDTVEDSTPENLDAMTLTDLKFLANQEDIDISGLTRKQDIIGRIRKHRESGSVVEENEVE